MKITESESTETKIKLSPRDYLRYLDILGFLGAIFFALLAIGYVEIFKSKRQLKFDLDKKTFPWLTLELWPFILGIVSVITGYFADGKATVYVCSVAASICLIAIAFRTFIIAHNPFHSIGPPIFILMKLILDKSSGVIFYRGPNANKLLKDRKLLPVALGVFIIYYMVALALTISLFGILIKSSHPNWSLASNSDFLLASILRFTSGSELTELFGSGKISLWLLAAESCFTFFYFGIAVLAFSTLSGPSVEQFEDEIAKFVDSLPEPPKDP